MTAVLADAEKSRPGAAAKTAIATARGGKFGPAALAALEAGDQVLAAFLRGIDFFAQGQVDRAAQQFNLAMQQAPTFAPVRMYLGVILSLANDIVRRRACCRACPRMCGGPAPVARLAAINWLHAGDAGLAIESFEKAVKAKDPEATRALALAYIVGNRPADAFPLLVDHLAAHPDDQPALLAGIYATYARHAGGAEAATLAADRTRAEAWAKSYPPAAGDADAAAGMDEIPGRTEMIKSLFFSSSIAAALLLGGPPSSLVAAGQDRAAGAAPTSTGTRTITESDLYKFVWIADPQISPDGAQIVFTRVVVNEKQEDYETSLWVVAASGAEEPRRLTSGTRDTTPRWSPDGRRIAFVRATEREGRTQPAQVFVLALDGGEARPLTDLPRGAGGPVWSPDGARVAFSSVALPDDLAPDATPAPPKSDVRVITSAVYRANGGGWNDPERPSHIWVTNASDAGTIAKPRQLTSGKYAEGGTIWSADGSRIFFTSTRVDEPYYLQGDSDLYSVPAAGGEIAKVASINGTIGSLRLSPDGKQIAFVGTLNGAPEHSYDQPDLFVANVDGTGAPRNLTSAYDFDVSGGIGGDQAAPRGGGPRSPIWSSDGRSITIVSGERGDANLVRFDVATGKADHVFKGSHAVQAYSSTPDARRIVALASTQTNIGDLFILDGAAAPRQITHVNDALFKTLKVFDAEEIWWTSLDGKKIQGWLMHPPDFDKSKKYPFILEIHGGPHSAYGNTFTHEFQWMAAKGYVVLFPNPRGSSNYGQDFGNIIQYRYPGDDYKDLMAGVDEVLKRGYIDEKRLGVTGGSGGGLLTNWTITQTTRFAAAVSQRSIADWSGFWYTADFSLFTPFWFRKAPWEDPADFTARSPITHIARVKTPLMLVDGDDDLRTPPSDGGEMMFRALKYLKVPTVMVRFPGETHELSRSGKPKHRVERLQHIVGWFDKWLLGREDARYQTSPGQ